MNLQHEALALLRNANPVSVDPAEVRSSQATATFERIVSTPLVSHDLAPRHRAAHRFGAPLRSPNRIAAGGAGIAAAAAAIVVVAFSGSSAPPAFAQWTPTPTLASVVRITAVMGRCGLGRPALVEVRGPYTAAVFVKRSGGTACVLGPGIGSGFFSLGGVGVPDNQVKPEQVRTAAAAGSDSRGDAYVLLAGRVGTAVRSLVIHRSNNVDVIATIKNGWYLAWWPARVHATGATVATASGTRNVSLPPLATTGPPSCRGRAGMACAALGAGGDSNGPGNAGMPAAPPLVEGPVAKPFNRTLLLTVDNAARVLVCLHPPSGTIAAIQPNAPAGPCTPAVPVTKLPAGWPVQRNLLEIFPNSIWMVRLPPGTPSHRRQVLVIAIGTRGQGEVRNVITLGGV